MSSLCLCVSVVSSRLRTLTQSNSLHHSELLSTHHSTTHHSLFQLMMLKYRTTHGTWRMLKFGCGPGLPVTGAG
jgi:hypothetical protein